jgi:aspartate carbamoyltransferase regulatory subunit
MKELTVAAISKGTVIDHIPHEHTFKVAEILGISRSEDYIVVANNLPSKKIGVKGLIKIKNRYLDNKDVQRIALFAPNATVSKIDDFKIIEKTQMQRPKAYIDMIKCFNPNCITNKERMKSRFSLLSEKPLTLVCNYCERELKKEDLRLI